LINDDPYGKGWLVTVEIDDPNQMEDLLSPLEYEDFLEKKNASQRGANKPG
jgi:glycine cleavage system H protein